MKLKKTNLNTITDFWREEQPKAVLFPEPVKELYYTLGSEHHKLYMMRSRISGIKRDEKKNGDGGESLF